MSAFGDAFKAARAAGKKTFTFNGKSYHTRTKEDEAKAKAKPAAKPDVSKATAGPAVYEKKKAPPMNAATEARVKRNALEQEAMRGEDMSKYRKTMPNNSSAEGAKFDDKGVTTRKSSEAKTTPNNRPVAKDAKYGDKSLSVNQRIKNDIKDNLKSARSSNTGTDKRSVTQRIKDSLGMMGGGKVKGYGPGGSIGKGYGKARGAKACKMR